MTGDFNKTAYISNHPRETSTNQILNAREHTKMEVDIKSSFASLKYVCNEGNSVYLIIISELYSGRARRASKGGSTLPSF